MPRYAFNTVDVFTNKALTGNPLAVVHDADSLDTSHMQGIARELNLSETVFVLTPHNPVHTARLRLFSPLRELPFAGHPTVGTAALLAERAYSRDAKHDALILLEQHIGTIRCAVKIDPAHATKAEFDVPRLATDMQKPVLRERIAMALGLMPSDIGFAHHKPVFFSAGVDFLCVPVRDREVLHHARPMLPLWNDSIQTAAYVYTAQPEGSLYDFRARVFAPDMGIKEDPATGSGAAALAGVLARYASLSDGWHYFTIEQGVEIARPSTIHLEVEMSGGRLSGTRIGGQAVVVSEGYFNL